MLVNEDLAQRIVDSTMSLVHRNVNIMNRDGMIIATGHPLRLHTFHKGAKDVIETGMVIEIYPEQLSQYPGALQGIKLPIDKTRFNKGFNYWNEILRKENRITATGSTILYSSAITIGDLAVF